jgi:hypothetical protein
MATKYIRPGETYCGDGTTSAAATVAGGVGAWNDINIVTGTAPAYGTAPTSGDTVYIKSTDPSNTSNITVTFTTAQTIGLAAATLAAPITWIVDGGSVWAGSNGRLTYSTTSTVGLTTRAYNHFRAQNPDGISYKYAGTAYGGPNVSWGNGLHRNWLLDYSGAALAGYGYQSSAVGIATVENLHVLCVSIGTSAVNYLFGAANAGSSLTLVNPKIEITNSAANGRVFQGGSSYAGHIHVFGGSISGAGASSGNVALLLRVANASVTLKTIGLQVPAIMPVESAASMAVSPYSLEASGVGMDGAFGSFVAELWGNADNRSDGYYPTLNATLPNSTSAPWSWHVYGARAALNTPVILALLKAYTQAAAIKTATVEFLTGTAFPGGTLDTSNTWVEISYIDDATGASTFVSSRSDTPGTALSASTAAWSATTWGAIGFSKNSIAVTTPTTIRQDTPVTVVFKCSVAGANTSQIFFVDPDPQLT